MQLKPLLILAALATCGTALGTGAAAAQSLSPMHKSGMTPSNTKGVRLLVGNPYKTSMIFQIIPMDEKFNTAAPHAVAQPAEIKLGPGLSRSVLVAFDIAPGTKERTIGVCVQPKSIEGPIFPRVCGTYTGILLGQPGG